MNFSWMILRCNSEINQKIYRKCIQCTQHNFPHHIVLWYASRVRETKQTSARAPPSQCIQSRANVLYLKRCCRVTTAHQIDKFSVECHMHNEQITLCIDNRTSFAQLNLNTTTNNQTSKRCSTQQFDYSCDWFFFYYYFSICNLIRHRPIFFFDLLPPSVCAWKKVAQNKKKIISTNN